jgi:hypothetical protein
MIKTRIVVIVRASAAQHRSQVVPRAPPKGAGMNNDDRGSEKNPLLALIHGKTRQERTGVSPPREAANSGSSNNDTDDQADEPDPTAIVSGAPDNAVTPSDIVSNDNFSPISAPLRQLTTSSGLDEVNAAVREWATGMVDLPPVEKVTARTEAIWLLKSVSVPSAAALVDAALAEALAAKQDEPDGDDAPISTGQFAEVEPWPDPVDGQDLIRELESFVRAGILGAGDARARPVPAFPDLGDFQPRSGKRQDHGPDGVVRAGAQAVLHQQRDRGIIIPCNRCLPSNGDDRRG